MNLQRLRSILGLWVTALSMARGARWLCAWTVVIAFAPMSARAGLVTYAFSGTLEGYAGDVLSGVFDINAIPFSGTFTYDSTVPGQSLSFPGSDWQEYNSTAYSPASLAMTLLINGTHAVNWSQPGTDDSIWRHEWPYASPSGEDFFTFSKMGSAPIDTQPGAWVDSIWFSLISPSIGPLRTLASLDPTNWVGAGSPFGSTISSTCMAPTCRGPWPAGRTRDLHSIVWL